MTFKIQSSRHRGAKYEFIIQGPKDWNLLDLIPYMLRVSKTSADYRVTSDMDSSPPFKFSDKKRGGTAAVTLEDTLSPKIKKLKIFDDGVGTTMINKFVKSIESEL